MPRPTLSQTMSKAMLARMTAEEIILLLTLSHANFVVPIRRALRRTLIISRGETFFPMHFMPTLPSQEEGALPHWPIKLDGVDQSILRELRAISTRPHVKIEVIRASDPDYVEMTTGDGYEVFGYTFPAYTITLDVGMFDLETEGYPGGRILPSNFPGGF